MDDSPLFDLFRRASEFEPDELQAFLAELGREDPATADSLRRLLEEDGRTGPIPARLAPEHLPQVPLEWLRDAKDRAASSAAELERLGALTSPPSRFEVRGEIARGGMGRIEEAWDNSLQRIFARKTTIVDARGAGDTHQHERFVREARITGSLQHPNIVPVYDLGVDTQGRAFFSMPRIRGRNLQEIFGLVTSGEQGWSRTRALNVLQRVCEAVAYAHSRGVIHRDLKPANVMVGEFGEVYVMDWGLAKVLPSALPDPAEDSDREYSRTGEFLTDTLGSRTPDLPPLTIDGTIVGTPAYMPPEQAGGRLDLLGPRSDIYSIGAILYELLGGVRPFHAVDEDPSPAVVLERVVQGTLEPLEERRPEIPPELVSICAKAMDRDIARRYPSGRELAEDLRAYLEDRVVRAHRTGPLVELQKWFRRNRALALTLSATILAILGGLIISLVLLDDVRRANTRTSAANERLTEALGTAEEARDFLTWMITTPDPERMGKDAPFLDVVRAAAAEVDDRLRRPSNQASVHMTLGSVFTTLGRGEDATRHFERAHGIRRAAFGADSRATLEAKSTLAASLGEVRAEDSERMLREVLAVQERTLGERHLDTLTTLHRLALSLAHQGRTREAVELGQLVLEERSRKLGPDHLTTLATANNLAVLLQGRGEDEGVARFLRTIEAVAVELPPGSPRRITAIHNLLRTHGTANDLDRYRELHREAEEHLGADHSITRWVATGLGDALILARSFDEAERLLRELVDQPVGDRNRRQALVLKHTLANLHYWRGGPTDLATAERLYEEVFQETLRVFPNTDVQAIEARQAVGIAKLANGKPEEAERWIREALELLLAHGEVAADDDRVLSCLLSLANVQQALGRFEEQERTLLRVIRAHESRRSTPGASYWEVQAQIAVAVYRQGRVRDAAEILHAVVAYQSSTDPSALATAISRRSLGKCLSDLGRYAEARTELEAGRRIAAGFQNDPVATQHRMRAEIYLAELEAIVRALDTARRGPAAIGRSARALLR